MIAFAQNKGMVNGVVKDADTKEPLIGVSIVEIKSGKGAVTDAEGRFEIATTQFPTILKISYIGYDDVEQTVIRFKGTEILMQAKSELLDEFVVTALGIKRETKALGYAIQEIDAKEIDKVPASNLLNSLAGRVAGVQINNGSSGVGSSANIVIRGESSLSGKNQALFVVDGVPISNDLIANQTENNGAGFQEVDYGNGAAEISPNDIESINILRGAGATALYGSRGANGVVLIKTKTGKNNKKGIGVSLNTSVTFEQPLRLPQYQNEYGQGAGGDFLTETLYSYGPALGSGEFPQYLSPAKDNEGNVIRGGDLIARGENDIENSAYLAQPNNVQNFFETGQTWTNNIALSGANDNGHFRFSYTNLNNKGIVPNTDLKRNSFVVSGGYDLGKRVKIHSFVNYINSASNNRPAMGYGSENAMYLFTWMGRQVDVERLKDYWQYGQENTQQFTYNYTWMDNPYFSVYENTNGFDKNRLLGNVSATLDIFKEDENAANNIGDLSLTVRAGMDQYGDVRKSKRAFSTQRFRNGAYREDLIDFQEVNTDFLLRYDKWLNNNLSFNLSFGGNRLDQQSKYKMLLANELSVPNVYNFENSKVPLEVKQFNQQKRVNSLYLLGGFGFKSALFFDWSIRNDWSSTLPDSDNSYAYYSASFSGILSEFIALPNAIDFAKFRLSYALVGNDTDPFNFTNAYQFGQSYGSNPTVTNSEVLKNSEFKPEFTKSFEAGIDLRSQSNKLRLDATYYNNNTTNQIVELPVPTPSGFVSRIVNGGNIRNQGIELLLDFRPIAKQNFRWNILTTYTKNWNSVEALPDGVDQYVTGFARVYGRSDRSVFYIAEEGGQIGDMYGTGLLTTENGQHVYDQNGNPVKDPSLRLLGNYNPDFIIGLDNSFQVGPIGLSFLFDWRQGGTIVSRTQSIASTSGVLVNTAEGRETGIIGDGVVNTGDTETPNYVPNTTVISAESYYQSFYDRDNEANALVNASYLKLREVSLDFSLPQNLVNKMNAANIQIALVGRNLAVWTENEHFDPELNALQGTNLIQGVEDMSYPSSRSLGLRLGIEF